MIPPVPSPATTKDTNPMTEPTVYASKGGTAFHNTRDCRAREAGQGLWDTDDWSGYAIQPTTIPAAMSEGKLPCRVCMFTEARAWAISSCEDDFGHEPVPTGHIGPDGQPTAVCARCTEHGVLIQIGGDDPSPLRVAWPCTSAVVLGLVPRPAAA